MQRQTEQVKVADAALDYLLSLVQESRTAGIAHYRRAQQGVVAARVWAYMAGRDYLLPDDIQAIFAPWPEHRAHRWL